MGLGLLSQNVRTNSDTISVLLAWSLMSLNNAFCFSDKFFRISSYCCFNTLSARNEVIFFGVSESGSSQFETYIEAGNTTLPCSSFISILPAISVTHL